MRLYIANATKQNFDFMYRMPEVSGIRVQTIPIGGQIQITGELSTLQVDSIIAQHAKYGMVSVDEIDRSRNFTGLCYSIDKQIPVAKIMTAVRLNTAVLQNRGKQMRQEAAVAENNRIERTLIENDIPGVLNKLEVSVVEEKDRADGEPMVAEGVRVTRNEPENEQAPPRRRRR